jgi:hypothetical protein
VTMPVTMPMTGRCWRVSMHYRVAVAPIMPRTGGYQARRKLTGITSSGKARQVLGFDPPLGGCTK